MRFVKPSPRQNARVTLWLVTPTISASGSTRGHNEESLCRAASDEKLQYYDENEEHQYRRIGRKTFDCIVNKIENGGDDVTLVKNICN